MTMDSPEFLKVRDCSNELGHIMMDYLVEHELILPHGLSVMAAATIGVIETICRAYDEDPHEMLDVYIGGLKEGGEDDMKTKGL